MDNEDKFNKNRKMTNSAGDKNNHSFIIYYYVSDEIENNLLKKVKNELKVFKKNIF
jgi:hypothetical protein